MSKLAHSNQSSMDEIERNRVDEPDGYWCVICNRFLPRHECGTIVHDAVPHPKTMTFDEQENPQ